MKFNCKTVVFVILYSVLISCSEVSTLKVSSRTTEYLDNPIGIDRLNPILSWKLSSSENGKYQSAYQIAAASSEENLENGIYDLWYSGKIKSSQNQAIKYKGIELSPFQEVYWKVKVWDESDVVSAWSDVAKWSMGPLNDENWEASWISHEYVEVSTKREPFSQYDDTRTFSNEDTMAVYTRYSFQLPGSLKKATAFVSGLGYYELFLNGSKVGDRIMDPVFTDYQKTVKYAAFDVTDMLNKNGNVIAAILGNGFYNHTERDLFQMEKANWKTPPRLLCLIRIELDNGEIVNVATNEDWKWSYGPIVYNSIRGGETLDTRIEFAHWNTYDGDVSNWQNMVSVPAPIGDLSYQYMPPMREVKTFIPVAQWSPKENVTVFDFGENMTGYADLVLQGEEGEIAHIHFNEALNEDSTLNVEYSAGHTWGRFQHGKVILSGNTDVFQPRFTYHGFRYLQVSGVPSSGIDNVQAHAVNTDIKTIGEFECSNERLNDLHASVRRTLLDAIHSMPGEEATREKVGWTLDGGLVTMESYLYNFDVINTYKKYLDDLIQAQEPSGHISPIVPTNGWGFLEKTKEGKDTTIVYDDPWWGGTIFYVANKLFEITGDTAIIEKAYQPAKKYADFVESTSKNHIVYWSLGDWLDLKQFSRGWGPGLTPISLTSTAANYHHHDQIAKFAEILGIDADRELYNQKAEEIKQVFNTTFLDESGWYEEGSQTAQALPLALGLVPDGLQQKVFDRLLEAIEANDFHTSVGFIGVKPMLDQLAEKCKLDIAYRIVSQERSPGWLHFVKDEKSTLGENLNAEGYGTSHHPFGAVIGYWMYEHLAGINLDRLGSQKIVLTPGFLSGIDWAKASVNTLSGEIKCAWKREVDTYSYSVLIPANYTGELRIPNQYKLQPESGEFTIRQSELFDIYTIPPGRCELTFSLK